MTNILIADDHTMFVDGMESILKDEVDFFVIGRSYDGPSVIQFINCDTPGYQPAGNEWYRSM